MHTPGVYVHEVGGIATHVHLCLTVPPTLLLSDFIGQLKGASAHEANQMLGDGRKLLEWQTGYGVVSFGTKALEWVKRYVRDQRQRHARGAVESRLERVAAVEGVAKAEQREAP